MGLLCSGCHHLRLSQGFSEEYLVADASLVLVLTQRTSAHSMGLAQGLLIVNLSMLP